MLYPNPIALAEFYELHVYLQVCYKSLYYNDEKNIDSIPSLCVSGFIVEFGQDRKPSLTSSVCLNCVLFCIKFSFPLSFIFVLRIVQMRSLLLVCKLLFLSVSLHEQFSSIHIFKKQSSNFFLCGDVRFVLVCLFSFKFLAAI